MGNTLSTFCCLKACKSKKVRPLPPVCGDNLRQGQKQPPEHPRAAKRPKRAKRAPAGDGGPASNIVAPKNPLNLAEMKDKVQREISMVQETKDTAERLRKVMKKEKHLKLADDIFHDSEELLKTYNRELRLINACIARREALNLPGMCEDLNEQNEVHPGNEAVNEPEVHHMDSVVIPAEVPPELEVVDLENASLPLVEEMNQMELPNMENVILPVGEEEVEDFHVDNVSAPEVECVKQEPPMSLNDFYCSSILGRGSFGKVLLAEYKKSRKLCAIKAIKKVEIVKTDGLRRLRYEKHIFQAVSRGRHPFLVNLYASFQNMHYTFFVMEYAAGGDLFRQLEKSPGPFSVTRATFYTACIVLGLEYLHEQKIIHRDLKLENVVLDHQGFAKITDFGLGKEGIGYGDTTRTNCGTLRYMAPEIIKGKPYTRAVDWWSLGVLIYLMVEGENPFQGCNAPQLARNILSHTIKYPPTMTRRYISLIKKLLKRNPQKRLGSSQRGAADVKEHYFFTETRWSDLLARKVTPPFVPIIRGLEDTPNFERRFTSKAPVLTPQEESLTEEGQKAFRGFDWVADWEG